MHGSLRHRAPLAVLLLALGCKKTAASTPDAGARDAGAGERLAASAPFARGGKQKILLPSGVHDAGIAWSGFSNLVFSRDDRVLFFATEQWVVTTGAYGVEVATGKAFFVTDGSIEQEIDHGPFKGKLVAWHFRLDEDHPIGSPDYTGRGVSSDIIDWTGKRVRRLPEDEHGKARNHILYGE